MSKESAKPLSEVIKYACADSFCLHSTRNSALQSNQGHFILHLACADLTDNSSVRSANKLKKIPFVRLVKPDMGETKERRAQTDAQST